MAVLTPAVPLSLGAHDYSDPSELSAQGDPLGTPMLARPAKLASQDRTADSGFASVRPLPGQSSSVSGLVLKPVQLDSSLDSDLEGESFSPR